MTTTPIPDLLVALVAHLEADTAVAAAVGSRVYGAELPPSETDAQPRAAIVVRYAGGLGQYGRGWQQWGDRRIDTLCYGADPAAAGGVFNALHPAMKQLEREAYADVLLHWARQAGGPLQLRDPDTNWPLVLSTWQVLASEAS